MRGLTDKVDVVAGGGSGIGAATAVPPGRGGRGGGGRRPRRGRAPRPSPPRCATPGGGRSACSSTSPTTTRSARWSPPRCRSSVGSTTCTPTPPTCRRRPSAATRDALDRAARRVRPHPRGQSARAPAVHPPRAAAPAGARRWRDRLHQLGGRPHRRAAAPVVRRVEGGHQRHRAPRRVTVGPGGDPRQRGGAGTGRHAEDGRDRRARVHASTRSVSGARPASGAPTTSRAMVELPDVRRRRVGQRPGAERRRGCQPPTVTVCTGRGQSAMTTSSGFLHCQWNSFSAFW